MGLVGSIQGRLRGVLGRTLLSGTETCSVEIAGRLAAARAREIAGPDLPIREDEGGAEVEVLAFRMDGLALNGAPWTGADYGEILFRLGVEHGGAPAWLALRCALDRLPVAVLAEAFIRYPVTRVRRIDVQTGAHVWKVAAEDRRGPIFKAILEPTGEEVAPVEVRPVLVRAGKKLLHIPWKETPAARRLRASVTLEANNLEQEALGAPARWESAVVHEGRLHHCGVASPV